MQGFMKGFDPNFFKIIAILAVIGSAAIFSVFGYIVYILWQHVDWV